jgi:hypothetical protein
LAFDVARLAADLTSCLRSQWPGHFNHRDYSGEWSSIALRSASGQATDIASVPGQTGYLETPLLAACPYFREVIDTFQCEKETVRLLRLGAGSVVHEHRDPGASYADGFLRLHIPITSNDQTRFVIDRHDLAMQPGECWYANFGLPHSVTNAGATDRVHLVIDGLRNAWTDALFRTAGYDFDEDARASRMDSDTTRRIVETLRARGTETDLRLAADMERQMTIERIVAFLESIGLEVRTGAIEDRTFVPGIVIHHGALVIEPAKLTHPGDLLHEAGHLAVMEPERRRRCHIDVGKRAAEEMMAIGWSYAASVHLGLDPAIVFHDEGYRGGSESLIENFTQGRYIGVPTLQWIGLTAEPKRAVEMGVAPYPHMLKWLRE